MTIVGLACIVGGSNAQTLPPQIGGDIFVLPHKTETVISTATETLWSKGNLTISLDGMAGADITTSNPSVGMAVAAHYVSGPILSWVAGLGCAYDVSSQFQLSDVNSKSVGLLLGVQIDLIGLLTTKSAPAPKVAYHVLESSYR